MREKQKDPLLEFCHTSYWKRDGFLGPKVKIHGLSLRMLLISCLIIEEHKYHLYV